MCILAVVVGSVQRRGPKVGVVVPYDEIGPFSLCDDVGTVPLIAEVDNAPAKLVHELHGMLPVPRRANHAAERKSRTLKLFP